MWLKKTLTKKQTIVFWLAIGLIILALGGLYWYQQTLSSQPITVKPGGWSGKLISPTTEPKSKDFGLVIERLKVNAPIAPQVDGTNESAYLAAVEKGVAHYQGTALPNAVGNVFIFGHSSYWKWRPGEYKTVFKELDQLQINDPIVVWYKNQQYEYKVIEKKIVAADDTSILSQETKEKLLTLMTCWPPGTVEKRYIVKAMMAE